MIFSIAVGIPGTFHGTKVHKVYLSSSRTIQGDQLTVCFPASPSLRQVLQDRLGFVLLDRFRHHIEDIVHDGGTEFEIEVRLHTLLGDGLGNALAVPAFELTGEEVTEPMETIVSR